MYKDLHPTVLWTRLDPIPWRTIKGNVLAERTLPNGITERLVDADVPSGTSLAGVVLVAIKDLPNPRYQLMKS